MSGKVPPSTKGRLNRAKRLFEEFTGHEANIYEPVDIPEHDTAVLIGELDGLLYTTIRDGVKESYIHEFKTKSRPLLCVSYDGKQLYIVGGRYIFKETGINDA